MSRASAAGDKGKKGPKKAHKSAEVITTDDDEDRIEQGVSQPAAPAPPPRPKPRPRRQAARAASVVSQSAGEEEEGLEQEPNAPSEPDAEMATPKQRPRPKPRPREPSASVQSPGLILNTQSPALDDSPNLFATPSNTRKRARSPGEEDEDDLPQDDAESHLSEPPESPAPPNASQETHGGELQIRRKRVRH